MVRPTTEPPNRVSTGIRLPRELHAALLAAAAERDVSFNWLVTRLLERGLGTLTPLEQVRDLPTYSPEDTSIIMKMWDRPDGCLGFSFTTSENWDRLLRRGFIHADFSSYRLTERGRKAAQDIMAVRRRDQQEHQLHG